MTAITPEMRDRLRAKIARLQARRESIDRKAETMIDDKIVKETWGAAGDLAALCDPAKQAEANRLRAQIEQGLTAYSDALRRLRQIEAQIYHAGVEINHRRGEIARIEADRVKS